MDLKFLKFYVNKPSTIIFSVWLILFLLLPNVFAQDYGNLECYKCGAYETYGFRDKTTGKLVSQCKYNGVTTVMFGDMGFRDGLAPVRIWKGPGNYDFWDGFIDKTGKEVIPCRNMNVSSHCGSYGFYEGYATVFDRNERRCVIIDKTGKIVETGDANLEEIIAIENIVERSKAIKELLAHSKANLMIEEFTLLDKYDNTMVLRIRYDIEKDMLSIVPIYAQNDKGQYIDLKAKFSSSDSYGRNIESSTGINIKCFGKGGVKEGTTFERNYFEKSKRLVITIDIQSISSASGIISGLISGFETRKSNVFYTKLTADRDDLEDIFEWLDEVKPAKKQTKKTKVVDDDDDDDDDEPPAKKKQTQTKGKKK